MVLSFKANRKKILAVLVLIAVVAAGFLIIPKLVAAPMKYYGETSAQRIDFLKSFGYDIAEEPLEARKVTIPKEFSEVYETYNKMQKAQGFDLKPYRGKECRQYIYLVRNYPNSEKEIHATLLVYEGVIIGGDVSCAELDGFMHGFALNSARYGEEPGSDEKEAAPTPAPSPNETETAAQLEQLVEGASVSETESEPEESAPAEGEEAPDSEETDAEVTGEDIYPTD